jgi:hypothetical protein
MIVLEKMKQYNLPQGIIITLNQDGTEQVPEGIIQIVPAWK